MKYRKTPLIWLGILLVGYVLPEESISKEAAAKLGRLIATGTYKNLGIENLISTGDGGNPTWFMIFPEKKKERIAPNVNQSVATEHSMFRGHAVKLSPEEYTKLKQWVSTQKIF